MQSEKVVCPYCGNDCELVDSSVIYGRSYGLIYLCRPCNAYVGTHKHSPTNKPLGTPANAQLREARKRAHAAFDPLWQGARNRKDARHAAYRLIQDLMDLPPNKAHIAMFSIDQCNVLVHLLNDIEPFD